MKTFAYHGFDFSGKPCRGLIEAMDLKEAREKLTSRGVLADRVQPASAGAARGMLRRSVWGAEARATFYREAGALLKAGIPLAQALDLVLGSLGRPGEAAALAEARDRIRDGSSLAEALAGVMPGLQPLEKSLITAGERTGALDASLDRLAGYVEDQLRLRSKVAGALIYPALVVFLAVVVGIAMVTVIVPSVAKLFEESRVPLPLATRILLGAGDYAAAGGLGLAALALAGWWAVRGGAGRGAAVRAALERFALGRERAGAPYAYLVTTRFARTLSALLHGGIPLVEALDLAGRSTGSATVGAALAREAGEMRHGKSLGQALASVSPLNRTLLGWVRAGESSGDLEGLLGQAAARYEQKWVQAVDRILALLEPALILAVGLFVLLVALAILLPITALNQALQ